jgi:hypothetical protein
VYRIRSYHIPGENTSVRTLKHLATEQLGRCYHPLHPAESPRDSRLATFRRTRDRASLAARRRQCDHAADDKAKLQTAVQSAFLLASRDKSTQRPVLPRADDQQPRQTPREAGMWPTPADSPRQTATRITITVTMLGQRATQSDDRPSSTKYTRIARAARSANLAPFPRIYDTRASARAQPSTPSRPAASDSTSQAPDPAAVRLRTPPRARRFPPSSSSTARGREDRSDHRRCPLIAVRRTPLVLHQHPRTDRTQGPGPRAAAATGRGPDRVAAPAGNHRRRARSRTAPPARHLHPLLDPREFPMGTDDDRSAGDHSRGLFRHGAKGREAQVRIPSSRLDNFAWRRRPGLS